jgi:hypothetical protein
MCFLLWRIRPWRWRWHVPSKRRLTFNELHGVISKNRELFIESYCYISALCSYQMLRNSHLRVYYFVSRIARLMSVCNRKVLRSISRHTFSWFSSVFKQTLRWFPNLYCSPPNLNSTGHQIFFANYATRNLSENQIPHPFMGEMFASQFLLRNCVSTSQSVDICVPCHWNERCCKNSDFCFLWGGGGGIACAGDIVLVGHPCEASL